MRFIQLLAGKSGGKLGRMFAEVDAEFIRATCRELSTWSPINDPTIHKYRVHGSGDHVISCPTEADLVIDGGHLIAITHADECVNFIRDKNR